MKMTFIKKLILSREAYWEFVLILIGFYGNWFFEFTKTLGNINDNVLKTALFVVSSISLFLFFLEMCYPQKSFFGNIRIGLIISGAHLFSTGIIMILENMFTELVWINGVVLWGLISIYEARVAYASTISNQFTAYSEKTDNDEHDDDNDEDDDDNNDDAE